MKFKCVKYVIIASFILPNVSFAGRALDRSEILEIFQTLTKQPQKAWILKGSIEAQHTEYQASTGCIIESAEKVTCNGERFIWQITMNSRTKYFAGESEQQDILKKDSDFNGNKERVFVWDGNSYTLYFKSGKQAIVSEGDSNYPVVVNGPLTAGFIPWGFGKLSYEHLIAMNSSANEVETDGAKLIYMTIEGENMPKIFLTLDPSKKYALLSCSMDYNGHSVSARYYNNYKFIVDRWIPTAITVEKYDIDSKLVSSDIWQMTDICPAGDNDSFNFSVDFEKGTLVQYHSFLLDKPLSYRTNNAIDCRHFLSKKIETELANKHKDKVYRNCATAVSDYILDSLGKPVDEDESSILVQKNDRQTSLYSLKAFIESKGLYCKAIAGCNVQQVWNTSNGSRIIVYLPKQRHFVVLAGVDDEQVWVLDMSGRRFLYNMKIDKINEYMKSGAYLLVSDKPIVLDNIVEPENAQLNQFTGGDGGYCCTQKIQQANIGFCSEMMFGMCMSVYTIWYELYKCADCGVGNECYSEPALSTAEIMCTEDMEYIGACTVTGDWKVQWARSCDPGY